MYRIILQMSGLYELIHLTHLDFVFGFNVVQEFRHHVPDSWEPMRPNLRSQHEIFQPWIFRFDLNDRSINLILQLLQIVTDEFNMVKFHRFNGGMYYIR